MRIQKLQWFSLFFLVLTFSSQIASAGLFDDDEQNWRRIFGEIKKINARLVSLEMGKLKAMESVQQDLSRQIEEIKNLVPNLQGSVEQGQAEVTGHFKTTNQKLADIETQIKLEIINSVNQQLDKINQQIAGQLNQQKIANDQFQGNLAAKFSDLKGGMAADMENFAKTNQKIPQELARLNSESMARVMEQMKTQKQSLDQANQIIKSELIPTIIKQNEDTSLQLRTEMSKTSNELIAGISQARKESSDALLAGLANIEIKNQKLLEVLGQSLKEGESTRGNIDLISQSMGVTHDNIVKLKDVMVQQLDTLSKGQQNLAVQVGAGSQKIDQKVDLVFRNMKIEDEKINKLAESLKVLQSQSLASGADLASVQQNMAKIEGGNALNGEKLNQLITSSTTLATNSNEMGQSIAQLATHSGEVNQSLQSVSQALQTIQGGLANVDLVNEKMTKLISILKTIAAEQGKFTGVLAGQTEIKQSQLALNQAQAEMSKAQFQMSKNQSVINQAQLSEKQIKERLNQDQARILKAQEEIKNAQARILKAQEEIKTTQKQTLQTQKEVQKGLADLSRKANVNISRNDAIRKTLSTLGKKSSSPAPAK